MNLFIVEGESPAIKLCGFRKGNYIVRSSKATLTFKTDQDTIDKGFKLFASTGLCFIIFIKCI